MIRSIYGSSCVMADPECPSCWLWNGRMSEGFEREDGSVLSGAPSGCDVAAHDCCPALSQDRLAPQVEPRQNSVVRSYILQ